MESSESHLGNMPREKYTYTESLVIAGIRVVARALLIPAFWGCFVQGAWSQLRIVVHPNVLVSRESGVPHDEIASTANPTNPKNLIVAGILWPSGGDTHIRVYVTKDGGSTWQLAEFEGVFAPAADPQVGFDEEGVAYLVVMSWGPTPHLAVYRSEDGGQTWAAPVQLPLLDHPQLVIDSSRARSHGTIYIWGMRVLGRGTNEPEGRGGNYSLSLYRSQDKARTFIGPDLVLKEPDPKLGANSLNPEVLSDGTLVLPYEEFEVGPIGVGLRHTRLVVSTDGGRSFTPPREVITREGVTEQQAVGKVEERLFTGFSASVKLGGYFDVPGFPRFAVAPGGTVSDNILYAVWQSSDTPASRIYFARSTDLGLTWSTPRQVDASVPRGSFQYTPSISVNKQGVVGVQWFDTRNATRQEFYECYFTASTDEGKSFMTARRISSKPSMVFSTVHLAPRVRSRPMITPSVRASSPDELEMSSFEVYAFRTSGGDYIELVPITMAHFISPGRIVALASFRS